MALSPTIDVRSVPRCLLPENNVQEPTRGDDPPPPPPTTTETRGPHPHNVAPPAAAAVKPHGALR